MDQFSYTQTGIICISIALAWRKTGESVISWYKKSTLPTKAVRAAQILRNLKLSTAFLLICRILQLALEIIQFVYGEPTVPVFMKLLLLRLILPQLFVYN